MSVEDVGVEGVRAWSRDEVLARAARAWAPRAVEAAARAARTLRQVEPAAAKRAGVVRLVRRLMDASDATRLALAWDPALGRWAAGVAEAARREDQPRLRGAVALTARLHVALSVLEGGDADLPVTLGSGGRARVPVDGRVLQGPAGRAIRVRVEAGQLKHHARAPRHEGGHELIDGDAEGGFTPSVQPLSGGAVFEAAKPLGEGLRALRDTAPGLAEEAAALAPALMLIRGQPEVSHSVSRPGVRGGLWLSTPHPPLVVAETLVHETSHLKYHLLADEGGFGEGDDPPRFQVPWRADLRPLGPALMGLHAWVRVARWLHTLEGGPWASPARQRLAVLEPALRSISAALADADGLTDRGRALVVALADAV